MARIMNDATGAVTAGGGLTGTADARFYGDVAQEFGGTFALVNTTKQIGGYYYGAFGTQPEYLADQNYNVTHPVANLTLDEKAWNRNDPNDILQVDVSNFAIPTNKIGTAYTSLEALRADGSLTDGDTKRFTLPSLGVNYHYRSDYTRDDVATNWNDGNISATANLEINTNSVVSLNYEVIDSNVYYLGGTGTEGVVLYRKTTDINGDEVTERYAGNTGDGGRERTYFKGNIIGNTASNYLRLYRGDEGGSVNFVGFVPENMVVLRWYIKDESMLGTDNLTNNAKTDKTFGYALAGLETGKDFDSGAFGAFPTTGNATFTGKGTGYYHYERAEYNGSNFDKYEKINVKMAAYVDFGSSNINFSIYNTCYYSTCTIKREGLDFNANLSFNKNGANVNNMRQQVTTNDGLLAGTLDARFYGDAAQEFGGTFAMTGVDSNVYYYGIFAGNQNFDGTADGFSFGEKRFEDAYDVDYYEFPQRINIPYASFVKAVDANDASRFVMFGTATQRHDITDYVRKTNSTNWNDADDADVNQVQNIGIVRSETPALVLDFDDAGKISAVETYFGLNIYTANFGNDATAKTANGAVSNGEYAGIKTNNISADRDAFGFTANYMLYVDWNFVKDDLSATSIADDIYDINGMMVAGVQTQTMPTVMPEGTQIIRFIGGGKGNYGNKAGNHSLTFDTHAEVSFISRRVALEFSNTACVAGACTLLADDLNALNFNKTLAYSAGKSHNRANMNIGGLSGKIETFFYGVGDDSASEFGGIFTLTNNTADNERYYYGGFGIYQGGTIGASVADNANALTITPAQPIAIATQADGTTPYASVRDAILDTTNTDDKIFTLHGPAIYVSSNTDYVRTAGQDWHRVDRINELSATSLDGAASTITVNGDGNISGLTLYLDDDKSYTINDS